MEVYSLIINQKLIKSPFLPTFGVKMGFFFKMVLAAMAVDPKQTNNLQ